MCLVGLTAAAHQLLMEFEIFLAGLVLHAHRDRDLRRFDRARSEHREFLQHHLELGIVLHQRQHVGHGALAVAAVVIEEFDEGDVAIRVAQINLARRREDRLRVFLDRRLVLLGFGHALALLEFGHCLLQHFRMRDDVFAHDFLDLAALRRREFGGPQALRRGEGQQRGQRSGGCQETRARCHRVGPCGDRLLFGCQLFLAFGDLTLTISSARTQAGEPTGRRVLARVASWRAVGRSPRLKAACAEARSALARSPLRP